MDALIHQTVHLIGTFALLWGLCVLFGGQW